MSNLKFMLEAKVLTRGEMREVIAGRDRLAFTGEGGGGGGSTDCTGFGTLKCNYDCPCTDPADWCVNGYCQARPL